MSLRRDLLVSPSISVLANLPSHEVVIQLRLLQIIFIQSPTMPTDDFSSGSAKGTKMYTGARRRMSPPGACSVGSSAWAVSTIYTDLLTLGPDLTEEVESW